MRTTIFRSIAIVAMAILIPLPSAANDAGHGVSLDDAMRDILTAQDANSTDNVDCDLVTDAQFAAVGEAYMGVMHPDEEEHASMDAMMGGEGSAQLEAAHTYMGMRYLDCADGAALGDNVAGMMMGGMTGSDVQSGQMMTNSAWDAKTGSYGMMGAFGTGYGHGFGWLTMSLVYLFLGLGIAWFARELMGKKKE